MKQRLRLVYFIPVSILVIMLPIAMSYSTSVAHASSLATQSGFWTNVSTIGLQTSGGLEKFVDSKIDTDYTFVRTDDKDGCPDVINDISDPNDTTAKLQINYHTPASGCVAAAAKIDVKLSKGGEADYKYNTIAFQWVDKNKIETTDGTRNYIYDTKYKKYYGVSKDGDCRDDISVDTKQQYKKKATLIIRRKYVSFPPLSNTLKGSALSNQYEGYPFDADKSVKYDRQVGACMQSKPITITLGQFMQYDQASGTITQATNGDPGSSSGNSNQSPSIGDSCSSGSGGGALRWILCPVVSAIDQGITWSVQNIIQPALSVDPIQSGGTLYEVWKSIRNVANALLILVFLVIIFANFFASEKSSYTVKSALPRLVAAAVLIQVSYFLSAILIDIGNIVGGGIGQIIMTAASIPPTDGLSAAQSIGSVLLLSSVAVTGGIIATVLGAWVLLLPLIIGLVISIITMMFTLGMRIIAINLLIMLAPVAALAWVLPNTKKYADMWVSNMLKLIMMYPLVIAIMAAASVIVQVGAGNDKGVFVGVLTLFAPMIAFFMIPATFKMSGTIIGGINEAIMSKGKAFRGSTAGALNKNMRETISKNAALKFANPESGRIQRTAARFGMGLGTGFGVGAQSRMKRAAATANAFKEKKELLHHDFEEEGLSGDNAAMRDKIFDTNTGQFKEGVDDFTRAAVMQMISENGGVEEMSQMYEALRARNGGESRSAKWTNTADRDLWNRATATTRDRLAQSLPYAVRPDSDRSLGKMDAEGLTKLKSAAGKAQHIDATTGLGDSHIERGLAEINARASAAANSVDPLDPKGEKILSEQDVLDAQAQRQKVLASMVGVGQSTDRRGRIDAENVKAFARAAKAGLLDGASMIIDGKPVDAATFVANYVDEATGQLKVVPTGGGKIETDEDSE